MIQGMALVSAIHEYLCRRSLQNLLHLMCVSCWVCILSVLTYFPLAGSTLCGICSGRGTANVVHSTTRRNCTGLFHLYFQLFSSPKIIQILWYNKSRAESRICPACQRLYRLGDHLPDLIDEELNEDKPPSAQLLREQKISGLCPFHAFLICLCY